MYFYNLIYHAMDFIINTIDQLRPILVGFRKSQGFSQKEFAKKLGVSQQTYQVFESNPKRASVERLYKILTILKVKIQLLDTALDTKNIPTTKISEHNEDYSSTHEDW